MNWVRRLTMRSIAVILLVIWSLVDDAAAKNNVTAICYRCQCLNVKPFSVDCNEMGFSKMPEFRKDLKVPWRFQIVGNSLTEVPAFPSLTNLTEISFKYNKISQIADRAFFNLTNLKSLDLSHNNLTADSLDSQVFRGPYSEKQPDPIPLERLNLAHNNLNRLQKDLFKHVNHLVFLDLSNNPFVDFSTKTAQSISELQNLKTLDLSYTKLRRLPDHFFAELINLEELDLSGNDFIHVPSEVNYAHSLKVLSLNDNIFGSISKESFWDTLDNLETLNLKESKTLFRVDNGSFGNLTSLKTLRLNNNPQLSRILPNAFMKKHNKSLALQELHLENNNLEYLPKDALEWKEIHYLNLQGNPWNCDCDFEYFAKEVIPLIEKNNYDLSIHITCASPDELMGAKVTTTQVQNHNFVCTEYDVRVSQYGFVVVATIVVGTLLLVTGTIIFSYVLFRRTKVNEWVGENVKYQRTVNEDDDVASTLQYQY